MQANCATVHQPNNLVINGRKRACRPLTSSKHTSHVDAALTRGANHVATLHSALLPSRRNIAAAASASPPAPATGEGQAAATDQLTTQSPLEFELACPICHSTSFRLQNVQGRPTGNLACPRCSRDFAANATCVDLTLTSGVQQRAYQQKRWGGTGRTIGVICFRLLLYIYMYFVQTSNTCICELFLLRCRAVSKPPGQFGVRTRVETEFCMGWISRYAAISFTRS
jgi:hypothetical protein